MDDGQELQHKSSSRTILLFSSASRVLETTKRSEKWIVYPTTALFGFRRRHPL